MHGACLAMSQWRNMARTSRALSVTLRLEYIFRTVLEIELRLFERVKALPQIVSLFIRFASNAKLACNAFLETRAVSVTPLGAVNARRSLRLTLNALEPICEKKRFSGCYKPDILIVRL
jgi:hypothetical protein